MGNPACVGGFTSGVHVHFGVKFENVWQPINLITISGWQIVDGEEAYEGMMIKAGHAERRACFRSQEPRMDCTHGAVRSDTASRQMPPNLKSAVHVPG